MVKTVIKRDGQKQDFCSQKIMAAISAAMIEVNDSVDYAIINQIVNKILKSEPDTLSVEDIQDKIEVLLMETDLKAVARAYISYRDKRTIARQSQTKNVFLDIIGIKDTDMIKENANMNTDTPSGMMMKFASESTKPLTTNYLLSERSKEAYLHNYIHIHDLDFYPTKSLTCVQYPLDIILKNGFTSNHGEYAPAKNIEDAVNLCVATFETCQNEMHGGQAVPALDFFFAPYVKKTYQEEVEKAISLLSTFDSFTDSSELHAICKKVREYVPSEYVSKDSSDIEDKADKIINTVVSNTAFRVNAATSKLIHDLNNIHSRGGNQVVFSSLNYGTDTSAEGRAVIYGMLKATDEGIGDSHRTAIFPIQIWKKKRGVSFLPGDPNYDLYKLACKVTAHRYFPNFINLDAPFNQHENWDPNDPNRYLYEAATMGCRTRVFENRYGDKTSVGRGNLSFTTINLPKLAIEAKLAIPDDEEARIGLFMTNLCKTAETVILQLDERFQFQKTALKKQFPFLMDYYWKGGHELDWDDTIESVINQGTLGVGFIGLAECLVALRGKHHGEDEVSQELGLRIVRELKSMVDMASEQYHHNYSVLATPAEGLSGKFTRKDRKEFGSIPGVTDRDFYTNSNHVPVYYNCTKKHKAEVEAPYHELTLGGHIFYIEIDGDATHNPAAIDDIVKLMDKYGIGYGSINHNRCRCNHCGYESANAFDVCPECGSDDIDWLARITGYLVGMVRRFNSGKLAEWKARVKHQ